MKDHSNASFLVILGLILVFFAGCTDTTPIPSPSSTPGPSPTAGLPPTVDPILTLEPEPSISSPTEGWQTSPPEAQGIDSQILAEMLAEIQEQDHAIDNITVIRNGYLVLDVTVHPFQPETQHVINSCTKSIVSILIGIAIDQGAIEGVDQPVLSFFPERTIANRDTNKEEMTLHDLLTMSSGFDCRDSYLYRWEGLQELGQSDDWTQFVLDLPMADVPGTRFEYCNSGSYLLSAILTEMTGQSALDYASEHLFGPLGITDVNWPSSPQGINVGWGKMWMQPHDMAKIGYLYLNNGQWEGEQIIPANWVAASSHAYIDATLSDGYGYQWWVDAAGYYMALGYAGQFIYVLPEKDMVVVFTSDLAEEDFFVPETLLNAYIIPAAGSTAPLPDNPDGLAALEGRLQDLAAP